MKPQRLLHNNLHTYSKILDSTDREKKKPLQKCRQLQWEFPYFLNITRSFINNNNMDRIEKNVI